jgi:Inorganic H+ pyrophosphatase
MSVYVPSAWRCVHLDQQAECLAWWVQASLEEMIAPGALVILTPIVVGTLFGTRALAGVLSGSLVSGVQMAVSMSNTGGAWDNAKKYVEVSTWSVPLPGCLIPVHFVQPSCSHMLPCLRPLLWNGKGWLVVAIHPRWLWFVMAFLTTLNRLVPASMHVRWAARARSATMLPSLATLLATR